jgi:EAL domain-containing protein (putative c-di-GMP-specific phosphodiesterase class I)/CHASE2 domain-containing sensor protein/GGDEF domain-containing protein
VVGLVRLLVAVAAAVLVFVVAGLGAFASLDRLLADARFAAFDRPASGDVVFVEIDSQSLAQVGVWPWPRQQHGEILDKLMALGAADVAFDIDFSSRSTEEGDAALEAALARAGGFTYLASFEQASGASGRLALSLPLPRFAAQSTPVLVNVSTDRQGLVVSVPSALATSAGIIPALPLALSGMAPRPEPVLIDYGIDLTTIDRISVAALLNGAVEAERIAGRQVIVGAGALELRDIFAVPRFGFIPGPLIQAAATETLKSGRTLSNWGGWAGLVAAFAVAAVLAPLGRRISPLAAAAAAAAGMAVAEIGGLAAYGLFGVLLDTAAFHVTVLGFTTLHTVHAFLAEYGARQRAQARLAYLAQHDPITGLLSRHGLLETLRWKAGPHTVIAIQLLRLDLVRGALGQEVHDRALKLLGERLDMLDLGTLALIGDDRFCLAIPDYLADLEVERLALRIRTAVEPELAVDGHVVHSDLATGVARGVGAPEVLVGRAELALAQALSLGSRTPVQFSRELDTGIDRRRRMDAGLRKALASGALRVVFQPQIRLADGEIVGVEALVRWHDEELGAVSPADFIPLAEESGLIVPLGAFVLLEACREVATWNWSGTLSVNVSPAQVQLTDVATTVDAALAISGLPGRRLEIEITESLLVDRTGRIGRMVETLRQRGVGVAIDDFGSGYSALSYLSTFAFDKLKIDQSFVRTLAAGTAQADVVQSIVELAGKLGKSTVAEGIETEEQRALLARMGCDIGQGYLFGRPVTGAEIAALVARRKAG